MLFETGIVYSPSDTAATGQHQLPAAPYGEITSPWGAKTGQDYWSATGSLPTSSNDKALKNLLLRIAAPGHPVFRIHDHEASVLTTAGTATQVSPPASNALLVGGSSSVTTGDIYYGNIILKQQTLSTFIYHRDLEADLLDSALLPPLTEMPLQLKLRYLDLAYTSINEHQSKGFLEAHPHLIDLLYAAVQPLRNAFPGSHFTLRVDGVPNPGLEENPEALLVAIWTKEDPPKALGRLFSFYKDWWLECHSAARGQLYFDVGFE